MTEECGSSNTSNPELAELDLAQEVIYRYMCVGCDAVPDSGRLFPATCGCAAACMLEKTIDKVLDGRGVPDEFRRGHGKSGAR